MERQPYIVRVVNGSVNGGGDQTYTFYILDSSGSQNWEKAPVTFSLTEAQALNLTKETHEIALLWIKLAIFGLPLINDHNFHAFLQAIQTALQIHLNSDIM